MGLWSLPISMVCAAATCACNVPVFRYALERWEPDPYLVIVFHNGQLTEQQAAFVTAVEETSKEGLANLLVSKVDLSGKVPEHMEALWKEQTNATVPWLVVKYPPPLGIPQPVWAGPLNSEIVKTLIDSPARREIARNLLEGKTAVWLLVESGNNKRDTALVRMLDTESRKLEKTLEFPEPDPFDPPMSTNLISRIAFSTVRISRSDPAEQMLIRMLVNVDPELAATTEEMLFPVFGRGRALPPAIGKDIREDVINAMAEFMTGPCSCQVKEMNPGFDLLVAANWNAIFEGVEFEQPELPPLVSLSQFAMGATNEPPTPTQSLSAVPAALATAEIPPPVDGGSSLVRNLVIVFSVGVFLIGVATFVFRSRSRKPVQ